MFGASVGRFWITVAWGAIAALAGCAVCVGGHDLVEADACVAPSPANAMAEISAGAGVKDITLAGTEFFRGKPGIHDRLFARALP